MAVLSLRIPIMVAALCFGLGVSVDGAAQQRAKKVHLVEVVVAQNVPLSFETVRTGTLSARRSLRVFNQVEGRIERIAVREGDAVRAGMVIVELDRKLLSVELSKATATRHQAQQDLARVRKLLNRKVTTQERLDKAEMAVTVARAEEALIRTRRDYTQIQAPFDGIVTERRAEPGDIAPKHSHILTIIDPASIYTKVSVSELMLPRLRKGDPIEVRIDALDNRVSMGRIGRIHPLIDPRTRQGVVEVEFDQVPVGAVSGQLCRVRLRTAQSRRLVIPFAALRRDNDGEYAFVVENGKVAATRVRTGLRLKQQIEIIEGISQGDRVVVRGFLDLTSGKRVEIVEARADPSAQKATK